MIAPFIEIIKKSTKSQRDENVVPSLSFHLGNTFHSKIP